MPNTRRDVPAFRTSLRMQIGLFCILTSFIATSSALAIGPDFNKISETIKNERTKHRDEIKKSVKSKIQELVSGMPKEVLQAQSYEKVVMPPLDDAIKIAQDAANEQADALIKPVYEKHGKTLNVPTEYPTIGRAIEAAQSGDTVLVAAGIYYEQLVMKDGIKLVSSSADNGDELIPVENARIRLPRRALLTIIDGSKTTPSNHGMVDFNPGVTRETIIDGFTIRNMPHQNHHVPGHAHGINVRGASPIIMNCYITNMGSTGIGNHVVYKDQHNPIDTRDFRYDNIKAPASAIIYHNIIANSFGLGIGCNHFSDPMILGNEVFANNDAELGDRPSPGMGNKHGSHATIIGNIVHDNPGGGILCQIGEPQGAQNIDRVTHPTVIKNVIYDNGDERPALASRTAGSVSNPVIFQDNYIYGAGAVGIGLSQDSVGIVDGNFVSGSKDPGIAINKSTAIKLDNNRVTNLKGNPGIAIVNGSTVHEMVGNAVDPDKNAPPYLLDSDSKIKTIH